MPLWAPIKWARPIFLKLEWVVIDQPDLYTVLVLGLIDQ